MIDQLTAKLAAVAASGVGIFAVVEDAVQHMDGIPAWVERLGIPVAFLALTLYAMKYVFAKYVEAIDARLSDKDTFAKLLVEQAEKSGESRERLIASNERIAEIQEKNSEDLKGLTAESIKAQLINADSIKKLSQTLDARQCGLGKKP